MKRLFLPLLSLVMIVSLVASCNSDDNGPNFNLAIVPIDSIQAPDSLQFAENNTIDVSYTRPNACADFYQFQVTGDEADAHVRNIAVVNAVYDDAECNSVDADTTANDVITKELTFKIERSDYYTLRFYQGKDDAGDPIFIEKKIFVATNGNSGDNGGNGNE